ncbi:hypothetical protein NQ315_005548 [Exocentrus adspersus]|uniref:Uncharacterized protein n=1 Tax=Exocentrus adspersus TaxID=1586481 RepID=A0AAV8VTD1_9CUCU|nr:hypothetical protein NQ315_005548 [Exocentrus adspersus]
MLYRYSVAKNTGVLFFNVLFICSTQEVFYEMMSESSCLFVMETDVAETQDDSELNVYDDLPSFDLGDELEKLKAEKRHLEEYVCSLKSDIESLKTAVAELTETKTKAEIERKDRMIEELRTNTGNNRFRFRPYYDNKRRVMESSPLDNFPAKKGRYDEIIEKADKAPSKSTEGKPSDEQVDLAGKNDDKSDHRKPSNEHENKAVTHEKSDHDKYASNLKHSTANTDNITDQGKHSDGEERRSRHNESLHSPRSRSVPSRYDNKAAKTDTSDYDKQNSKHRESEELGSRHSESTRYHRSRSVPRSNDNNLDMAGKSNTSDCDKQDSKHQEAVEWRLRRLEFTDSGESKSVPRSDDSKSSKYGDKPDNRAAKSDTPERDRPSCKRSDDGDGKEQRPRRSESTPRHREATRSHRSRSGDKLGDRTIKSDLSDYDKRSIKRSDSEERRYRYPESTNPYHRGYRNGGNYRGQRRFRHFRGRGRPYNERKYSDERWNDYNNERRYPNDRRNSYEDDLYYNKYNYCSSRYSNKSDDRYNSRTRSDDTYDCRPERYDGFEEREYGNYNRNLRDDNQTAQYRDDNIVLCRDDDRGIQCRNDDGAVQCRDEEREFLHRDDERALVYEIGDGEVQYRDEDRTVQYRDDDRGLGYSEYMEAALYRDDKRSVYGDYDDHEGGDRYFRQELSDYNDPMYVDDELGRPLERPNRSRSNTPFSHEGNKAKNQIVRPKKLEPFAIEKEQDTQRSITPMPLPEDIEDPKDDTLQELVQGKNDSKNEATAKVDVTCAKQETVKTVERNEGCDKKPPKKRLKILEVMERRVRESRLLKESNNNSLNETTKKNRRSTDADCDKNSVTSSKSNRSDKSDKSSGKVKCGKGKISNTSNEEFTKVKSKSTKANKSENKLEVLCKSIIVGDAKQSISLSKKSVAEDIAGLKGTTLITDLKKI